MPAWISKSHNSRLIIIGRSLRFKEIKSARHYLKVLGLLSDAFHSASGRNGIRLWRRSKGWGILNVWARRAAQLTNWLEWVSHMIDCAGVGSKRTLIYGRWVCVSCRLLDTPGGERGRCHGHVHVVATKRQRATSVYVSGHILSAPMKPAAVHTWPRVAQF